MDISRRRQISRNIKDISRRRRTLIMLWKDTPQLCAVLQRKYKKSSKWQIPNYCIYNISIVIWICWMKCQMYKVKYSTVGNQVNIIFEYCWFWSFGPLCDPNSQNFRRVEVIKMRFISLARFSELWPWVIAMICVSRWTSLNGENPIVKGAKLMVTSQ